MKIERLMTKTLVTVELDDSLRDVKRIFDNASFHHLLVVEKSVLYGVLSDRDLLKTISPHIGTVSEKVQDLATLNKKAHQIMTPKPICLTADQDIYVAIETFNKYKLSCIPIINEHNHPVGILSWRDILKAIEQNHNRKKLKKSKT
ncbi:CBS domain-containing protein [Paraglaciecola sp. L3A3]|uniref:CBS domain-containing protein n=1 Tax=Paraglaciecola sp. L3A3 TaxID=2686358 RepID=UPI00131A85C0|nr:CBS domain-containing protein [Paraglaciecola sp. L3A3]